MSPEYILEYFRLWNDPKHPILTPKPQFFLPSTPIFENVTFYFSSLTHFLSTNLQIHAAQNVPTDHTDHFGFQQKIVRIWEHVTKKTEIWEKVTF